MGKLNRINEFTTPYSFREALRRGGLETKPVSYTHLDVYKRQSRDTPDLHVQFVELDDPTGPFGNKALGEPPAIPVAPAIRNAVLNATGVAVDSLPLDPQKLVAHFKAAELI